jgi:spore coat protein CotH
MTRTRPLLNLPRRCIAPGVATVTIALLAGCSGSDGIAAAGVTADRETGTTESSVVTSATADITAAGTGTPDSELGAVGTLDSSVVHEISLTFDQVDFDAMVKEYSSSGDKEWIEASISIDGATYEQVGIRLKGNSSLRGIAGDGGGGPAASATGDDPATLPWLIKLDKFVDDQNHEGLTDLVVRSNGSSTSLNEAVALELLDVAGLASQDAIAASFRVNGAEPELRLVIEHPDDTWMAETLDEGGALYKAESSGDYSYRGDDPAFYDEVFDQEAGEDNADLTPLIELLDFINNADDTTFEAQLADWLDIDSFATYLAMQELLNNFDDIDGPGNNSYLYYDTEADTFTVVPWDHNLAFGLGPGGGGPGGRGPGEGGPGGMPAAPDSGFPGTPGSQRAAPGDIGGGGASGGPAGGPGGRPNVLVQRFLAVAQWETLYQERLTELRTALYDSDVADSLLARWTEIIRSSGLVEDSTITTEADQIAQQFG